MQGISVNCVECRSEKPRYNILSLTQDIALLAFTYFADPITKCCKQNRIILLANLCRIYTVQFKKFVLLTKRMQNYYSYKLFFLYSRTRFGVL